MTQTQMVHTYFRGSAEISKRCRGLAFVLEVLAAVAVLRGPWMSATERWVPFFALLLLVGASILRVMGDRYKAFADYCRQISVRAFSFGHDVPVAISSNIRSDAPAGSLKAASKLPAYTLEEYYEPQATIGEDRLRELYAYGSFYSFRLMRICKYLYGTSAAVILIGAVTVLYSLADGPGAPNQELLLDALFSVVLGVVGLRIFGQALEFASASAAIRRVADSLIAPVLPTGDALGDLAFEYEIQTALAPPIPTLAYRATRKDLDAAWRHRRGALGRR